MLLLLIIVLVLLLAGVGGFNGRRVSGGAPTNYRLGLALLFLIVIALAGLFDEALMPPPPQAGVPSMTR